MNLFRKILLASSTVLLLASLVACTLAATDDPQRTDESAAAIADFDLPAGYSAEFSTSMLGYSVAAYKGPNGPAIHI